MLLIGWSFIEGIGAVLIMPAIVGLVASNFPPAGRPRAYGLIAAAAAIAIAVGPVIGGFMTTYFSWRYVFAGEVIIVIAILFLARRAADEPVAKRPHLDLVGAVVSSAGLALFVLGVLKSSTWGWILPKDGATSFLGLSLTIWFIIAGLFLLWLFLRWQQRLERAGKEPLIAPSLLRPPAAHRRSDHLPVPVPDPGGSLLHRAAVPLGGARSVAHGDGHAAAAAVAGAARRRGRHPALLPQASPRRVVAHRPAGAHRRRSSC